MNKVKTGNNILEQEILSNKDEFIRDFEKTFLELEAVLQVQKKSYQYCQENNYTDLAVIWNFGLYLNVLLLDSKHITYYLILENKEWQRCFFGRNACTLIYESLEGIPKLIGKNFREVIKKFKNEEEFIEILNLLNKKLHEFKNKNIGYLKLVRNESFAHRDLSSTIQLNRIDSIEWSQMIDLMISFDKILRNYGAFIQNVQNQVDQYNFNS